MKKKHQCDIKALFAKNLKTQMSQQKIGASQLADSIGLTRAAIYQFMSGDVFPSTKTLLKISQYFEVEPEIFLIDYNNTHFFNEDIQSTVEHIEALLAEVENLKSKIIKIYKQPHSPVKKNI